MHSIEETYEDNTINIFELEQDSSYNPDNIIYHKEFTDKLTKQIEELPEREQIIFCLYFYEDVSMREIGEILNLQEARISQILRKAVLTVKMNIEIRNWFIQ